MDDYYCLLVPHYNHHRQLSSFLPALLATGLDCIIVDDGSEPEVLDQLAKTVADIDQVWLLRHGYNRGKGAAIKSGMAYARALGFTHVLQIDADGQHDVDDIAGMLALSQKNPTAIISGRPQFADDAPKARQYGRKVSDVWAALETLSLTIKDCLCGFRVYPLRQTENIIDSYYIGNRMDVDTELLVKACWLEIPILFIDTQVAYPESNISHFNYLRDNLLLIKLHVRLLFGALIRLPKLLLLALRRYLRRHGYE